jgi:hypothetical protein
MRWNPLFIFVAAALGATACHLDNKDRCGDEYVYDASVSACVPVDDTDTGTDTSSDADADADAGGDGSVDTDTGTDTGPSGPMEPCSSQEDCAAYDASYCMLLMTPNVCLLPDCTTSPDNCPDTYTCCAFTSSVAPVVGVDSLCIPDTDFATYASYCVNG